MFLQKTDTALQKTDTALQKTDTALQKTDPRIPKNYREVIKQIPCDLIKFDWYEHKYDFCIKDCNLPKYNDEKLCFNFHQGSRMYIYIREDLCDKSKAIETDKKKYVKFKFPIYLRQKYKLPDTHNNITVSTKYNNILDIINELIVNKKDKYYRIFFIINYLKKYINQINNYSKIETTSELICSIIYFKYIVILFYFYFCDFYYNNSEFFKSDDEHIEKYKEELYTQYLEKEIELYDYIKKSIQLKKIQLQKYLVLINTKQSKQLNDFKKFFDLKTKKEYCDSLNNEENYEKNPEFTKNNIKYLFIIINNYIKSILEDIQTVVDLNINYNYHWNLKLKIRNLLFFLVLYYENITDEYITKLGFKDIYTKYIDDEKIIYNLFYFKYKYKLLENPNDKNKYSIEMLNKDISLELKNIQLSTSKPLVAEPMVGGATNDINILKEFIRRIIY
jgi:hypothetical protein